ncbi:MAG: hypothetical protein NVSMB48_00530 [Marmoricola sp.]
MRDRTTHNEGSAMPDKQDFTSPDTLLRLLTRARDLAEKRVLDEPLDLRAADVALGIAVLREKAGHLAWGQTPVLSYDLGLGLVESLERAEVLTRDLLFVDVIPGSSEFVGALCDLIREARSLA